jgi:thiol-disulfide isomerase/thioredoxin
MKQIISILVLCLLALSCKTEEKQTVKRDGYYISGTAPGVYNGIRAYLETEDDRGRKVAMDTAIIMNEKFVFDGKVDFPKMISLKVNSAKGVTPLILENGELHVSIDKDNMANSKVEGTEANDALNVFNETFKELSAKRIEISKELRVAQQNENSPNLERLKTELREVSQQMEALPYDFISKHQDNPFALLQLQNLAKSNAADFNKIEAAFNSLSETQQNSMVGSLLKTQIQTKKAELAALNATQIGNVAPSFSGPTPDGKQLALDDVKGKLTLIDFWASWCKPCRMENPNVVKVYQKYHSKGLEIISVSLDGSRNQKDPKAAWIKAIEEDNLTWNHISNLNYFNDPVAKSYNIRSIPATFLLDENGRIIAKNLRGNALEEAIAKYLN